MTSSASKILQKAYVQFKEKKVFLAVLSYPPSKKTWDNFNAEHPEATDRFYVIFLASAANIQPALPVCANVTVYARDGYFRRGENKIRKHQGQKTIGTLQILVDAVSRSLFSRKNKKKLRTGETSDALVFSETCMNALKASEAEADASPAGRRDMSSAGEEEEEEEEEQKHSDDGHGKRKRGKRDPTEAETRVKRAKMARECFK